MMPQWVFGLWQSRQRYKTAQESLDIVKGFRSRGIPFDNIVQDWFYWKADAWGSHQFEPARFPDPAGWIQAIHDQHARLMISVWPKFYPGTENFEAMHQRGFLYERDLQEKIRDWVGFHTRSTTPSTRRRGSSSGRRSTGSCSASMSTPGGWMRPNRSHASADSRGPARLHEPDRARTRIAVLNAFPLEKRGGGLQRPARCGAGPAGVHPDALRFCRSAALRGRGLVG